MPAATTASTKWRAAGKYRVAHERAGGIARRPVDRDLVVGRETPALAEIGQHLDVAPPGGATFGPGVKIARMALK